MHEHPKLTIRAFRAVDEPATCALFVSRHRAVLESIGISNVTTNNDTWCQDPDTYVIVAESPLHGMVGGIRLEVSRGGRLLPITRALVGMDPRIEQRIEELSRNGTAEICGLWNDHLINGRGLPILLSFAAVSIANQINIGSLTCLVAHYTLRHALRVGFTLMEDIGDGGTFTYPIPSIKAIAMVIPDSISLDTATIANRQQLLSLRVRPEQTKIQSPSGYPLEVTYSLIVDRKIISITPYRIIEEERLRFSA
jgi:hypothetical protein